MRLEADLRDERRAQWMAAMQGLRGKGKGGIVREAAVNAVMGLVS